MLRLVRGQCLAYKNACLLATAVKAVIFRPSGRQTLGSRLALLHQVEFMLCRCRYLCKVDIGILLPESTLVPLGCWKGWAGHSMQDASSCPASQVTPLQAAKLSRHVASPCGTLRYNATHALFCTLFSCCLMLRDSRLISWSPARSTAMREVSVSGCAQCNMSTSLHPQAWFTFSSSGL